MRIRGAWLGLTVMGLGLLVGFAVPADASGTGIAVASSIDGRPLKDAGANSPIALHPTDRTVVRVAVTNSGTAPVEIRSVRLDARVLGLAFFSYTTRVDLTVAPGAIGTRTFVLDLGDLDGQATGLLPAELALISPDRSVLASERSTVDVKGKITSVYGVFGLAVAAITGLLLLGLVLRLVRRTLPRSRWTRALRFAVPGLGLGLTATFSLGVLRVLVPSLGASIALVVGGLVVGFALGYLTPSPADETDRDELDERDLLTPASAARPVQAGPTMPPGPILPPGPQGLAVPGQPAAAVPGPRVTAPGRGAPVLPVERVRPAAKPLPARVDDPRQTRQGGPPAPPPDA